MNSKYSRPEVKVITKQYMRDNYKNITERDLGLLRLLADNKRRLLRRDQIERLYPEFASTDRLNKRLKVLFQKHIIDKIYPPVGLGQGSSKQYVCLDRGGWGLLGFEKYNKPITLDPVGNRSIFSGWEHKVEINECECVIKDLVSALKGDVLLYSVEEMNEYTDEAGEKRKIVPDILCILRINGRGYLLIIEVDMGTEDIPTLKNKLDSYRSWYISKCWANSAWSTLFRTPAFPRVLFMCKDAGNRRLGILREYTEGSSIRFTFSSEDIENSIKKVIGLA